MRLKMLIVIWIISFCLICFCAVTLADSQECQHKDYGNGGTVCVCTANYCDTVPTLEKLPRGKYQLYTSNKEGERFLKSVDGFARESLFASHLARINSNIKYQTVIGFGGAFTDAAGINIKSINEEVENQILRAYFGKDGIEYSLGRVPIGGTDFSTHAYSYDDGPVDVNLSNFSLANEDYIYKITLIKKAKELTNDTIKLFSSAWTAPKWMKTNNAYNGMGYLKKEMYMSWAQYFLKFLDAYKTQGIEFWGITTGNEPINGLLPFSKINSVGWLPSDMSKWLANYLCPVLRKSDHKDIKIIALDDQRLFLPWYIYILFKNKRTKDCVDGVGVHWYLDFLLPASLLVDTHKLYPDKFILATEACTGDKPWENKVEIGSWHRGERYAESILEDLNAWVTGWMDWNLALDTTGGPNYIDNFVDSPILVNSSSGEFYKQPMFYALGHFSKFVPPGSVRIHTENSQRNVKVMAFLRPDNAITVIVYNKHYKTYPMSILDPVRGYIKMNVTAKSINTLVYW